MLQVSLNQIQHNKRILDVEALDGFKLSQPCVDQSPYELSEFKLENFFFVLLYLYPYSIT